MPGQVLDEHGNVAENCFQISDREHLPKLPAVTINSAPTSRRAQKSSEPLAVGSVLKQLTDRLRVVEREIRRRSKLEQERDQLKRLISAAKIERSNLRRIRAAG